MQQRIGIVLFCGLMTIAVFSQQVIDGAFPQMRHAVNAQADLLLGVIPDRWYMTDQIERIRDYALDEPWGWTDRTYHRIELAENPALNAITDAHGIHSFAEIINTALDSGMVTQFDDMTFNMPMMVRELKRVVPSPIILKVDFTYNDTTHAIEPHIIGFSFQQADGELVDFYYPELRFVLDAYQVPGPDGPVKLSAYFDRWMFISHRMENAPIEDGLRHASGDRYFEQQSEFDALTSLFLLEHEIANRNLIRRGKRSLRATSYLPASRAAVAYFASSGSLERIEVKKGKVMLFIANYADGKPNGAFREFHPDGSLKQQGQFDRGLRSGQWASWFANRSIRSRRMYGDGRLDGQQRAYHDNGNLFLEYDMVKGEYEGHHESYYRDGRLKTSGDMKGGYVTGEWSYSVQISDSLKAFMDANPERFDFPSTAWQDNYLDYRVTYTQTGKDDRNCPLRKCIEVAWLGQVE